MGFNTGVVKHQRDISSNHKYTTCRCRYMSLTQPPPPAIIVVHVLVDLDTGPIIDLDTEAEKWVTRSPALLIGISGSLLRWSSRRCTILGSMLGLTRQVTDKILDEISLTVDREITKCTQREVGRVLLIFLPFFINRAGIFIYPGNMFSTRCVNKLFSEHCRATKKYTRLIF